MARDTNQAAPNQPVPNQAPNQAAPGEQAPTAGDPKSISEQLGNLMVALNGLAEGADQLAEAGIPQEGIDALKESARLYGVFLKSVSGEAPQAAPMGPQPEQMAGARRAIPADQIGNQRAVPA